jgi:hypothetical protein
MNKFKKYPSLTLLNSEGDILKIFKTELGFIMVDEFKNVINILDFKGIFDFTRGKFNLINSEGEVIDYLKFSSDMKPNLKILDEFIGVNNEGYSY